MTTSPATDAERIEWLHAGQDTYAAAQTDRRARVTEALSWGWSAGRIATAMGVGSGTVNAVIAAAARGTARKE